MTNYLYRRDKEEYLDLLEAELAGFVAAVAKASPSQPVATCPPWTMAKLARHAGLIQRWVSQMLSERAMKPLDMRAVDGQLPASDDGYPAWLEASGKLLLARLRDTPPDMPVWTWGQDYRALGWCRRSLFETIIHRRDAEMSSGEPTPIAANIAVEGIDEFLVNLPEAHHFSPSVLNLKGSGESLHFHCTDTEGEWIIRLEEGGFTWEHGHAKGDVAVRGTASDLLLLFYGRLKASALRFQLFGDATLLGRWLENARI